MGVATSILALSVLLPGPLRPEKFGIPDLCPEGVNWLPFQYPALPRRASGESGPPPADVEARALLEGFKSSLARWEGERDYLIAREAILTWDRGRAVLPYVTKALRDGRAESPWNAVLTFRRIGPSAASEVAALTDIIDNAQARDRIPGQVRGVQAGGVA